MDSTLNYQVGDRCFDFVFTKTLPIEELQLTLYELTHEPTGATVVHLANDDVENLFCLSFRTLPSDSTGVAHILEHTVLCGSKKFPVKDPFFSMTRRSLNTFMNAMTGSDATFYPAASQVEADFYHLLDVYLDAVFFPKLNELSFLQEGHRLDFEIPGDILSPILFKGVVFNEMKGSLSSPESRLWHAFLAALTPDLTYAFNSGGDPKEIPNLSYQELKAFHQKHYHPSRCLFFFYGNLPLKKHLEFIQERVLANADKKPPLPPIPKQHRFTKPVSTLTYYPFQGKDSSQKTFITYGWLTALISDQDDVLALTALDSMLMETDASPLKKALLESKLCTQADSYLEVDMSEVPYAIVCKGCDRENEKLLQKIIFDTLYQAQQQGFSAAAIEAAVHQLSFSRLEITRDHGPFGLTLFGRAGFAKQHGCPAESALTISAAVQALEKRAQDPHYFSQIIEKYLLNNPHFVTLTLAPDSDLAAQEQAQEKATLEAIQARLSTAEREKILTQAEDLKTYQLETENQSIECLPAIKLSEIPKDPPDFPLVKAKQNELTVFHHRTFTNHITYADLVFDLPPIDANDLGYLQLFVTLIPELGLGKRDYQANLAYINAHLGDFSTEIYLHPQAIDGNALRPSLSLRGKALSHRADKLFALFRDTCSAIDLKDKKRIAQLILQIHTMHQNRLNRNALNYAIHLVFSGMSTFGHICEKWGGLDYFHFIRDLAENLDKRLPLLLEKFEQLRKALFHGQAPTLILSCDAADYEALAQAKFYQLDTLPTSSFTAWESPNYPLKAPLSQGKPIASPVAFSALGFRVQSGFHSQSAALSLATYLLENTILHAKIREQGGAYGSGVNYNPTTGHFYFYAYRDPHIAATYQTFYSSIEALARGAFTERDMREAKLGLIQNSDAPISPGNRAWISYCREREGKTRQLREEFRQQVLKMTSGEIIDAVQAKLSGQKECGVAVTFADQSLLEAELTDWPILPI
ncbi:MAG: insulinase family protein [Chlamydiota bacterium]